MLLPSYQAHFSRALASPDHRWHLAAHSHHLWPDVSLDGQLAAWQDAARRWDEKWDVIFGQVIPTAQRHIARHLGLARSDTIAFAPNTHDFVRRLLSALPAHRTPRVLTTDGEFHSLSRQLARLVEDGLVVVESVPVQPFESFVERFRAASRGEHDMVFVSQVFFNSGWAVTDLAGLVGAVGNPEALMVIDGYHGFMARPTDLSAIQNRVFYLSGGYKYAMAGEGACFLHCPPGFAPRPRDTGWYAGFGALSAAQPGEVSYGSDYSRFLGATFDPSGLYRLNAVMGWLEGLGVDAAAVHERARAMQAGFIAGMDAAGIPGLASTDLSVPAGTLERGNFLAFVSPHAPMLHAKLMRAGIVTDVRGHVLRVGFGLYHDPADIPDIVAAITLALGER
jgi:selenocysteine lyase/cysteine desulfurase